MEQRAQQRHAGAPPRDRTDELVAQLREQLNDMRNERDTWRAAFEREQAQRALPVPGNDAQGGQTTPATDTSRLRRTWRWLRSTG